MSLTPQITLTATLDDITGQPAGSMANPAKLIFDLCGYGLSIPQIPGTSTLVKIHEELTSTGTEISVALWGNDVITPGPDITWYQITVVDGDGNTVQSQNYRFDGTQVIDLSSATPIPIVPPTPPDPLPRVLEVVSVAGVAVFDASLGSAISLLFHIVLHENVTFPNASFINLAPGTPYQVVIEQNSTGNWDFQWPDNVGGPMYPVNPTPSSTTSQNFVGINGTAQLTGPSMMATGPGVYLP